MVGVCPGDESGCFVLLAWGYNHLTTQSVWNEPQGEVWPRANYMVEVARSALVCWEQE